MTDKTIQISIKQRVPLDIFCCTLADYLNKGEINEQYLLENLHSVFSGEYNIKLTFNYIKSSILNPLINETLVQNKTKILAALKIPFEANVIAISLINVRFPFCYYFTTLLAKYRYSNQPPIRKLRQNRGLCCFCRVSGAHFLLQLGAREMR